MPHTDFSRNLNHAITVRFRVSGTGCTTPFGAIPKLCDVTLAAGDFEVCGSVEFIDDESLMDAVTAVSGSGPAYLFLFVEALAQAGKIAGLPAELSARLALQTVAGAANLAQSSDFTPSELRAQVTSPYGTTAAALHLLMNGGRLSNLLQQAVIAAKERSSEK